MKYCPVCEQNYLDNTQQHCDRDGHLLSLPDPYQLVGHTLIEKYRIDALVSIGGMGAVYSAHHLGLNCRVALKILLPNLALGNPQMAVFFRREAELAAQLDHPNIVNVMDAGRTPAGIGYIVMEWLEGRALNDEMLETRMMSLERTAVILRQIAAALDHAHARNIVHRDLKPANIMLVKDPDGREVLKVVDFGIAKAVSDATSAANSIMIGTPHYASPEQYVLGGPIDQRSDIYSLGVLLFQMLAGRLPFEAKDPAEVFRLQNSETPPSIRQYREAVPVGIEQLLSRMLSRDPNDRPRKVKEVSAVFEHVLIGIRGGGPAVRPAVRPTFREDNGSTIVESAAATQAQRPAASKSDQVVKTELEVMPVPSDSNGRPVLAPNIAPVEPGKVNPPSPWNYRRYALVAVPVILAIAAIYYFFFYRPNGVGIVGQLPTPTPPTRIHLMSYSLEVTRDNCEGQRRGTGQVPLNDGESFRLHFMPRENGYLYIIAPKGAKDVPATFLTGIPDPASGVTTNFVPAGGDFSFPTGADNCFGITDRGRVMAFTVIFSPAELVSPGFFAAPAGRELNAAEQLQLTDWRQHSASSATQITPDEKLQLSRVTVEREANAPAKPVVFNFLIKHK